MVRSRLRFLAGMAAWGLGIAGAQAQQRAPASALRLGVERWMADTGLATSLRHAFTAETGLAVTLVPGPSSSLLEALERGELDAALTQAPALEARLEAQGLAHDRHLLARSDLVLVGPMERGKDPAGIAGLRDAAAALARIAQSAAPFLTLGDGSGAHLAEQELWRSAGIAPAAPWYLVGDAQSGSALAQARARSAYALVDRASWLAAPAAKAAPHGLLVEGDPRLASEFHVQRSFRINHPAGKLFVAWLAGPQGRRVIGRARGLHPAL